MNFSRFQKLGLIVLVSVLMEIGAPQIAWGGLQEGLDAYNRKDYASALKEWKPLAEQGNARGMNSLGVMYHYGLGVPRDYKLAMKWYRKSAEQGNASAMSGLGDMYYEGLGVRSNVKLAMRWYRRSVEHGDSDAKK